MNTSTNSMSQRFANFTVGKGPLFWCCAASAVATIVVGFAWGGWVTGGTAAEMTRNSARDSRADLAASFCVERFKAAADAPAQLTAFKALNSWSHQSFVEKAGWTLMPGETKTQATADQMCAARLATLVLPTAAAVDAAAPSVVR